MTIFIDKAGPNGNAGAAMGLAAKFMRANGYSEEDVADMRKLVMFSDSYDMACGVIEHCTNRGVVFYDRDPEAKLPKDLYL